MAWASQCVQNCFELHRIELELSPIPYNSKTVRVRPRSCPRLARSRHLGPSMRTLETRCFLRSPSRAANSIRNPRAAKGAFAFRDKRHGVEDSISVLTVLCGSIITVGFIAPCGRLNTALASEQAARIGFDTRREVARLIFGRRLSVRFP